MADEMPSVVVLLPVFNDWQALSLLLPRVASYLAAATSQFGILIVDDCSTVDPGSLRRNTPREAPTGCASSAFGGSWGISEPLP
jgi:hypothetical protein